MNFNIVTVVLAVVVYAMHNKAWCGVMAEPRGVVTTSDLAAAGIWFLAAAYLVAGFASIQWRSGLPEWCWPLVVLSASGLTLNAVRCALGLDLGRQAIERCEIPA